MYRCIGETKVSIYLPPTLRVHDWVGGMKEVTAFWSSQYSYKTVSRHRKESEKSTSSY